MSTKARGRKNTSANPQKSIIYIFKTAGKPGRI
jgi:hypothetical protein